MENELLKELSFEDLFTIDDIRYHKMFENCIDDPASVHKVLREWAINKAELFEIFGNSLIVKKSIDCEQDDDCYCNNFNINGCYDNFLRQLSDEYFFKIEESCVLLKDAFPLSDVAKNKLSHDITAIAYDDSVTWKFKKGTKLMKVFQKLSKKEIVLQSCFERFRLYHSTCLQQKKVQGNLVLSIHPVDFLTMSDNSYKWTSCMSNINHPGEYRAGTIEMMNSPCIVEAYLEGDKPYKYLNHKISNKKWRALFIVTPYFIVPIKGYPYQSTFLENASLEMLLFLVKPYYGDFQVFKPKDNRYYLSAKPRIALDFTSKFMYNDTDSHCSSCYAVNKICKDHNTDIINLLATLKRGHFFEWGDRKNTKSFVYNFSGKMICMHCGAEIDLMTSPQYVTCDKCRGHQFAFDTGITYALL